MTSTFYSTSILLTHSHRSKNKVSFLLGNGRKCTENPVEILQQLNNINSFINSNLMRPLLQNIAAVYYEKNDEWIKQLLAYFNVNNCFIDVGLSHLGKQFGLIQQLKRAGYEVEPVDLK